MSTTSYNDVFKVYAQRLIILCFLFHLHHNVEVTAYKISIATPEPGSHVLTKLLVGEALVKRGHQVSMIISDKSELKDLIASKGITVIQYKVPADGLSYQFEEASRALIEHLLSGDDPIEFDKQASKEFHKDCEYLMNDTEALNTIRMHDFDLFIVEPFFICPCNTILPVYLGKPYVSQANIYSNLDLRTPALPSFVSMMDIPVTVSNMHSYRLMDKLSTIFFNFLMVNPKLMFEGHKTDLLVKYAPQFNSWWDIMRQSRLILIENDYHLGSFVPALPNFVNVAGLTITPIQPLPDELDDLMTSSQNGVILVSFGTVAYYFHKNTIIKFMDAFSRLNQTVLARLAVPDDIKVPSNVKLLRWLPQNDILGHKNTKIFITHCGNNGQYEALHYAVPMIAFPLFAEQKINAKRTVERGYGLSMEAMTFTAGELYENILEIIYNKKYKNKIEKDSEIWRDEYNHENPLDRATFWIEHVIQYGGNHLRSPSLEQSMFEFLMLDVVLLVLVAFLLWLCLIKILFRILKSFLRNIFCKRESHPTNKKRD